MARKQLPDDFLLRELAIQKNEGNN
jgi:cyclophilin family peptidyl-prolyl cis-trans isomerase